MQTSKENQYDFIVIGGGSGGIAAANRAATYGARVALIESGLMGGTCVNVGCVPKKIMWMASQCAGQLKRAVGFGFSPIQTIFDWQALVGAREAYITRLRAIYKRRLDENKVTLIQGIGRFENHQTVLVNEQAYQANHILIATGAEAIWPDIEGADLGIDSNGFFALNQQPQRVAIVESGYIAVELAGLLRALGSEVHWVFRRDKVLREFDELLGDTVLEDYQQQGIVTYPLHQPSRLEKTDQGLVLHCDGHKPLAPVDQVIWAIGRRPQIAQLKLNNLGISGEISIDAFQNTSVAGIYAVGDVASPVQLTPLAIKAGRLLADRLFGKQPAQKIDQNCIPTVIFSHPPIGTIGMSEREAKKTYGEDVKIYLRRFKPMQAAFEDNAEFCVFKLITQASTDKIIGCHLMGEMVDEILQGFAVAIQMGATKQDFDNTLAIHPTIAEELVTIRS